MSLKSTWKRVQFELDARDIGDPSHEVVKEMEKEGWTFKLYTDFSAVSMYSPVFYTYLMPVAPDNKPAFGGENKETYQQYCDARRKAAQKVYGIE